MFSLPDAISLGRFLLEATKPAPDSPSSEKARLRRWLDQNADHPKAIPVREMLDVCPMFLGWTAAWARSGFQRVIVGYKLAASLMATIADDVEAMTCSP